MSRESESSKDSSGWVDFTDPKKVAYGLGALVATIGVGIITVKGGKKLFIAYADRRTQQKGLLSVGELEEHGTALSVAEKAGVLDDEDVPVGHDLFSMDKKDGFSYPLDDPESSSKYTRAARKIWNVIKDHVPSTETQPPAPGPEA